MSIKDCLAAAVKQKAITKDEADHLLKEFDKRRASAEFGAGAFADQRAKTELMADLKAKSADKRRIAALALKNLKTLQLNFSTHRNINGKPDVREAAMFMIEHFGEAKFLSVNGVNDAIVGQAHGKMEGLLYHFRKGAIGGDKTRHNKADMDNVLKEVFGEDTGDVMAKGLAKAWTETAEWLRQRFNANGGSIRKLENWGLPQSHDGRALREKGLKFWKEEIIPLLDIKRMKHGLTGRPVRDYELDELLDEVWEAIATDGWSKREPARRAAGRGSLAGQHTESRFLVFKDAQSWMQYQKNYGQGDPFAAMMGHVGLMSKEIAMMEVLGPNPNATLEWMKQVIMKEGKTLTATGKGAIDVDPKKGAGKAVQAVHRLEKLWDVVTGQVDMPVNQAFADTMSVGRNIMTFKLGSAVISSMTDNSTALLTRQLHGISKKSYFGDLLQAMTGEGRRDAVASGLIADHALSVLHRQARYVGRISGPEWSQYVADRMLTWSGLSPWTQAARHAHGFGFMRQMAKNSTTAFDALPDNYRRLMSSYGISEQDWGFIQRAKHHQPSRGTEFLRPREIAELDPKLAEKVLAMIHADGQHAVPTGSDRARSHVIQNKRGTGVGELARSGLQFKHHPILIATLMGARAHMLGGWGPAQGAGYAASMLLTSTLLGAVALQAKQIVAGRDPMAVDSKEFWGAALAQGGGLGIWGDFLFADANRYGGGLGTTAIGPLGSELEAMLKLTWGNLQQATTGQDTNFGKELVNRVKANAPVTGIWYLRLGFERVLFDSLQHAVDPKAGKSFKRKIKRLKTTKDQEYFWKPGELTPDRAPAF